MTIVAYWGLYWALHFLKLRFGGVPGRVLGIGDLFFAASVDEGLPDLFRKMEEFLRKRTPRNLSFEVLQSTQPR